MLTTELKKSTAHVIVEIIEYVHNAVVSKTIFNKTTGNITLASFDAGETPRENTSPFDTYIQVIDGASEITVDEKKYLLRLGDGIIIPAQAKHCFHTNKQSKMIATIVKFI